MGVGVGDMQLIPLTQGKSALVDDQDFKFLSQWKWFLVKNKYAGTHYGENKGIIYMHRLIMNFPKKLQVDHINRNTLDNRRENLRTVTQSQNLHNTSSRKNNKSGYKGVHFDKRKKKYIAQIMIDRKYIFLGHFDNAIEASKAYQKAGGVLA
jgi:hypothetical protein